MVLISVKWLFMHFDSCHAYIFYIQLFQKRIKIQINIWRNTFYKERVHVYICEFLTSSILIDEVNNYTGVILTIACFDLNCPLFTCLDFWHRLSSISFKVSFQFLVLVVSRTLVVLVFLKTISLCFFHIWQICTNKWMRIGDWNTCTYY